MFDRIFDFLLSIWTHILPFAIVNEYEEGIRLRLGKLIRPSLKGGIHFKMPFADRILTIIVTIDILNLDPVNVTTRDNITISVGGVIEFTITDIIKYVIDTNDARTNIHDIARAVITDYLTDITWLECKDKKTTRDLKKLLSKKCEEMGVTIDSFTLTDMCLSKVLRLINTKTI